MPALPEAFLGRPIAHRALHGPGAPENSGPAIARAIAAGYGIEIDVQLSSDGRAMVFHDYDLQRLTGTKGAVQQRSAAALADLRLLGTEAAIPTLREVLAQVEGAVPLLIEVKDQDGTLGPRDTPYNNPYGGSLRTTLQNKLIIPLPVESDGRSTRLSLFYDIGNVFADPSDFEANELRQSAGIAFSWFTPFLGLLDLSYAFPLNDKPGDETDRFQITFGPGF